MTQELILVVLLSGLVGLIWVMTVSVVGGDRRAAEGHDSSSEHRDDAKHQDRALKQSVAA